MCVLSLQPAKVSFAVATIQSDVFKECMSAQSPTDTKRALIAQVV
jgi:hypothetical protein